MLRVEGWMDVHVLAKAGWSHRAIAAQTGLSRNMVKKLLAMGSEEALGRRYRPRGSKLDQYLPYLAERYRQTGLSAVRLHEEIAAQGYTGGIDVVRR